MSQYTAGNVSVTNGSATVTGTTTEFVANVAVGDSFKINGESATYAITAIASNTSLTISPVYAGTTKANVAYVIAKDFTTNHNLYEPNGGDLDWPFLMTQNMRRVDSYLPLYAASQTPGANQIPVVKADTTTVLPGPISATYAELGGSYYAGYYTPNGAFVIAKNSLANAGIMLTNAGNLLVGVTSGSYHVFAKASASNYVAEFGNSSSNTPWGIKISLENVSNSSGYFLNCIDAGASRCLIAGNGNVTNVNNSYGAISDIKLKENIIDSPSYWNKFKQYRFVNYNLVNDNTGIKLLGLVAQEAELISPSVVEETPDFVEVEVEVNGEVTAERQPTGETTKSVKYSVVTLQAEVVLQEAQRRIEELEAKLSALEERLLNAGL